MAKSNQCVVIKGRKEGISIWLDERADFEKLKEQLQAKVSGAKQFFADADANVAFKGRLLSEDEEKALTDIILSETTLELSFVETEGYVPASAVPAPPPAESPAPAPTGTQQTTEHMTAFYQNGLRSGQSIRYSGSVVVMGDANPGSEIIANGNVIVLGSLKGMVHAGASGDSKCYVSALSLMPTQLRIANIITYIPPKENNAKENKTRKKTRRPSYAYIQDGQVYIAPLWD
ncbi:MAG: septum site-determining protein MinC [Clostridiales bacterium]|jgi:septum site-determining protein MinC|nr:septum site-determining protein MinC [Clostridiales bacterium]